jgi:hypothetical protein
MAFFSPKGLLQWRASDRIEDVEQIPCRIARIAYGAERAAVFGREGSV